MPKFLRLLEMRFLQGCTIAKNFRNLFPKKSIIVDLIICISDRLGGGKLSVIVGNTSML